MKLASGLLTLLAALSFIFIGMNSPLDNYHGNDESLSLERGFVPGAKAMARMYRYLGDVGK